MIRAEHITKSFDGRVVLDDISIEFLTGKTNLIIGRSGSGKTVLLKTLVGLHEPDSGDVWYDDTNFTRLDFRERRAIRKDIGMISRAGRCSTLRPSRRTSSCRSTSSPRRARKRRWNVWISACSACGWKTPTTSIPPSCRAE